MASHEIYANRPLDPTASCIRLIEIVNENTDLRIKCRLHVFPLSSCPSYTALYYTWGEETERDILIDDKDFAIRKNLWDFLCNPHKQGCSTFFWIDAIRIDQGNVPEVNHQVAMMREIYSMANSVLVWLGPADDDSDAAMEFMMDEAIARPWSKSQARALLDLSRRSYWKRMWIVQEFLIAHEMTLLCGTKSIDWSCLKRVKKFLEEKDTKDDDDFEPGWASAILESNAFRIVSDKLAFERLPAEKKGLSLKHLVEAYFDMDCQKNHDKIFALLGLALPEESVTRPKVIIDYAASLSSVCDQTLQHVFMKNEPSTYDERSAFILRLRQSLGLTGNPLTALTAGLVSGEENPKESFVDLFLQYEALHLKGESGNQDVRKAQRECNPLWALMKHEGSQNLAPKPCTESAPSTEEVGATPYLRKNQEAEHTALADGLRSLLTRINYGS